MDLLRTIIVDDEQSICEGLSRLIDWQMYGFTIAGLFRNGAQALAFVESQPVDLVITDIQMPVMNGLELIGQLHRRCYAGVIMITSGYNEFEYAHKALEYGVRHYLLKPIDERSLINAIVQAREEALARKSQQTLQAMGETALRETRLNALLFSSGGSPQGDPLWEDKDALYCVAVLRFLSSGNPPAEDDVLAEQLSSASLAQVFPLRKDGRLYFLCRCLAERLAALEGAFAAASASLLAQGIDHIMALGGAVVGLQALSQSRNQALAGMERAYLEGINRLIMHNESLPEPPSAALFNWQPEKLIEAVDYGFESLVDQEVAALFTLLRADFCSAGIVQTIVTNAVFQLNPIVIRYGNSMGALLGNAADVHSCITSRHTLADLEAWFRGVCKTITRFVAEARGVHLHSEAAKVKEIVDAFYMQELRLKEIADSLFFSPDYLGRMFREAYGMGFTEYLNKRRIRQARQLLADTGKTVQDISACVGYQSMDYFTKQFKRYEGKSPTEYRNMIRGKGKQAL